VVVGRQDGFSHFIGTYQQALPVPEFEQRMFHARALRQRGRDFAAYLAVQGRANSLGPGEHRVGIGVSTVGEIDAPQQQRDFGDIGALSPDTSPWISSAFSKAAAAWATDPLLHARCPH
jgi:hypothetical protein